MHFILIMFQIVLLQPSIDSKYDFGEEDNFPDLSNLFVPEFTIKLANSTSKKAQYLGISCTKLDERDEFSYYVKIKQKQESWRLISSGISKNSYYIQSTNLECPQKYLSLRYDYETDYRNRTHYPHGTSKSSLKSLWKILLKSSKLYL